MKLDTKIRRAIGVILLMISCITIAGLFSNIYIPILSTPIILLILLVLGIVLAFNIKITFP